MPKHAWAAMFAVAALSACNFTGQGQHEAPPPVLTRTTPADLEVDTARDASVTAEFDVELDAQSVDPTTAWISGPEGNTIPASVSVEGHRLNLTPVVPLPGGTTYAVHLADGIRSIAGVELGASQTLRFATKAQAWQPELTVASEFASYEDWLWPDAAADEKGHVLVAWLQPTGETSLVTVVRLDGATGDWGETVVFPTASHPVGWPRVFAGADGDAHLVWSEDSTDGVISYMASYRAAPGTWSTPVRLEGVPAGTSRVTPLVERDGTITLVCKTDEHVLIARYDAAQGLWSESTAVEQAFDGRLLHVDARLVADEVGNVLLAWMQVDESRVQPVYATRFDSASRQWAAVQKVAADTSSSLFFAQAGSFTMGVDAKGNATMAWSEFDETTHVMAAQFDSSTGLWTAPVTIAQGRQASVVVDPAGFATVAWQEDEALFAARRAPGATSWSQPMRIGERETLPGSTEAPQLATDIAGNVTAVYGGPGSGTWIKASRFSVDTGRWSAPQSIDTMANETLVLPSASPAVAIDASGTVTAAWLAYRPGFASAALAANRLR